MDFIRKFLFILIFIILWDTISNIIDKGFIFDFNEINVFNYILKTIVIFILFLIISKLIQLIKNK